MKISDIVAEYIFSMLEESQGNAEIQRNELAIMLGCVPSQINYVITSRFTPELGYLVESRRGGGGFIRITRLNVDLDVALLHIINSVGISLDYTTAESVIENILRQGIITQEISKIMKVAISDRSFSSLPIEYRNTARASVFKNMLLSQSKQNNKI
ncbi:MAG: CtsR family transcriptional regulator [Bacillota bacterium]|nr:CtsR family transcriptional regulator [Bacillota bacterium]